MSDAVTEAVARALYARWCTNCDSDGWEPDWSSAHGDGWLARAEGFRDDARSLAPFDDADRVGRLMCWQHCLGVAFHRACESPEKCAGLEDWQQKTLDAIMRAAREASPTG